MTMLDAAVCSLHKAKMLAEHFLVELHAGFTAPVKERLKLIYEGIFFKAGQVILCSSQTAILLKGALISNHCKYTHFLNRAKRLPLPYLHTHLINLFLMVSLWILNLIEHRALHNSLSEFHPCHMLRNDCSKNNNKNILLLRWPYTE